MSFHNHDTDDYNKKYSPSERERATKFGKQLLADHDKRQEEKAITALQQEAQINEFKEKQDHRAEVYATVGAIYELMHWEVWPYLSSHDADAVVKRFRELIQKLENLAK